MSRLSITGVSCRELPLDADGGDHSIGHDPRYGLFHPAPCGHTESGVGAIIGRLIRHRDLPMQRSAPLAAYEPDDASSSRHDVSPAWLGGLLGLVIITPTSVLAAAPSPPALDMALIRQLAEPQVVSSPDAGVATPPQTAPAAASVSATADVASAKPAVGSTQAEAPSAVGSISERGRVAAANAPAVSANAPPAKPAQTAATTGQSLRSPMDVALIRQLAQSRATSSPAPAGAAAKVDVPNSLETMGAIAIPAAPRVPGASTVAASAATPRPVQPTKPVAAPAPSDASTAQPSDRRADQRFPLDKQVIAALASGDMSSMREQGEPMTDEEPATPTLPQTQMDMIKGVFAPEMRD